MVKVKTVFQRGITKAFSKATRSGQRSTMADVTFKDYVCRQVLAKKARPPKKRTPLQAERRLIYCECDDYLNTATTGQLFLWKRYYWRERYHGRTLKKYTRIHGKAKVEGGSKHMGYRAYFMKKCMLWNLLDFFVNWLEAKWRLESTTVEGDYLVVKARIVNREDVKAPIEPREYKAERPRF